MFQADALLKGLKEIRKENQDTIDLFGKKGYSYFFRFKKDPVLENIMPFNGKLYIVDIDIIPSINHTNINEYTSINIKKILFGMKEMRSLNIIKIINIIKFSLNNQKYLHHDMNIGILEDLIQEGSTPSSQEQS